MDKVSILIPTYNRSKYICSTINSCIKQSYENIEIIVYDDGSTDDTSYVINTYLKNLPIVHKRKIKYIKNKTNNGIGYSRNILLNNINGDYACWLDSDDLMSTDRISDMLNELKESNVDIIYCTIAQFNFDDVDIVKKYIKADISKYDYKKFNSLNFNTTCATALFKSELSKFSFYPLRYGSEDVLWLWKMIHNNVKIGYLDKPLYLNRVHDDRIGVQKRKNPELKLSEESLIHDYLLEIKKESKCL